MTVSKTQYLDIDPALQARLAVLAEKQGFTFAELADSILRAHADEAEMAMKEYSEDEQRWQKYLESGASVPFDHVRSKLQKLATQAAERS